jgi:hypothetical protein
MSRRGKIGFLKAQRPGRAANGNHVTVIRYRLRLPATDLAGGGSALLRTEASGNPIRKGRTAIDGFPVAFSMQPFVHIGHRPGHVPHHFSRLTNGASQRIEAFLGVMLCRVHTLLLQTLGKRYIIRGRPVTRAFPETQVRDQRILQTGGSVPAWPVNPARPHLRSRIFSGFIGSIQ